jgi:hypothetical protein
MNPKNYPEGYDIRISDHFLNHVAAGVNPDVLFSEIKDAYERSKVILLKIAEGK